MAKRLLIGAILGAASTTQVSAKETVTYFLAQKGAAELLQRAEEIADPTSDNYGAHLTYEEVVALQRPHQDSLKILHKYLDEVGADDRFMSDAGDKVVATLPDGAAATNPELEQILDGYMGKTTQRFEWQPVRKTAPRPVLKESVDAADPQKCLADRVTPECLRTAYGVGSTVSTHANNSQAVIVNQNFAPSDLAAFLKEHKLNPQTVAKTVGDNSGDAGDEATLDVEYIIGMGSGTPTWWVYIDGHADNPFATWITYMSNAKEIPLVQSLSVGCPEGEVGEKLAARMNAEFAALGARGVSILFASGDSGYVQEQKFGSASPFVTSVGGVWNGDLGDEPLGVDTQSTGGFSSLKANAQQPYQKKAVDHYMTTTGDRPGGIDTSKRCTPDLTAYDAGYYIVQGGSETPIGGTSAATPVVAGMMSLINDALLQAGHSSLGFLNPLLYNNEDAFLDVVRGNNGGFAAVEGYDPASGLGTFSVDTFSKLKAAAIAAKERAAKARMAKAVQIVV